MKETKSALIIANSQYDDPDLRQLVAPSQDADALARVLSNPAIGGFDVKQLLNRPAREVSEEIERFFLDRSRDDLLLLYFSGHGIKDDDGQLFFATTDTRLIQHSKPLRSTAVGASFVKDVIRSSNSRRQVLMLDCCYSGAFARALLAKGGKGVGIKEHFEEGRGLVVLTASDSLQYSFEGDNVEGEGTRSVFTRALVEGVESGEADLDGDGLIDLDELYGYVHDRIRKERPEQRPMKWDLDVEGKIVIARNAAPPKPVELPAKLREAIDNPLPEIREGAVRALDGLLRGAHRGLALSAHAALLKLQEDDSRRVSRAAKDCLAAFAEARLLSTEETATPAGAGEQTVAPETEVEDISRESRAQESGAHLAFAPTVADPVGTSDLIRKQRKTAEQQQRALEAAIAKRVPVGRSTELLAMVRRTDSGGLRALVEIDDSYGLTKEDIRAKPFELDFPLDAIGAPQPIELTLRVDSPDFEPKQQSKKVLVPPDGDSEPCSFVLTPMKPGGLFLSLEVLHGDRYLAARPIRTEAEVTDQEVIPSAKNLVSIPLLVVVYRPETERVQSVTPPAQFRPAPQPLAPGEQTGFFEIDNLIKQPQPRVATAAEIPPAVTGVTSAAPAAAQHLPDDFQPSIPVKSSSIGLGHAELPTVAQTDSSLPYGPSTVAAPKSGSRAKLLASLAILVVTLVAGGNWYYMSRGRSSQPVEQASPAFVPPTTSAPANTSEAQAHLNSGNYFYDQRNMENAVQEYREAIRLAPDYAEAHYRLGNALYNLHNVDGAAAEYREVIRLKPDDAAAHFHLGNALYSRHDWDGAVAEYRQAIRLSPDDPEAHYKLGIALEHTGDHAGSLAEYSSAEKLKPENSEYSAARARLAQELQSASAPGQQGMVERSIAPAHPRRIRVGGQIQQGRLTYSPAPAYPASARSARVQGVVRLEAIIGTDGTVQGLSFITGHPLLVSAAMDAVKKWRYKPTLLNGVPAEVVTEIDVNFELSQ